ncbi:WbqC family protein [Pseudoalteromonas sp. C2R02]|uniref:WbqC family protein n=1 Tax=Pseudoalteromonas sp. C2R02 TaxID=2841565 RepID=UPI001C081123|nr:WbqC family protein [Pseudoalteromonas sp. C2R02]MBU2971728.1 WbqC family protein [Pseudoalteromonas sp. C2R02]
MSTKSKHKIAILQSNYIPWMGYFDIIRSVDTFIIYDCVQYTKSDWRNRNQILMNGKKNWLTIPVNFSNKHQLINETQVPSSNWAQKHYKSIRQFYQKAPFFHLFEKDIEKLYIQANELVYLSEINKLFITYICSILEINTKIVWNYTPIKTDNPNERLINTCHEFEATNYLTGPSAKNYLDTFKFNSNKITVDWFDYPNYQHYNQLKTSAFIPNLSIFDTLFNTGSCLFTK